MRLRLHRRLTPGHVRSWERYRCRCRRHQQRTRLCSHSHQSLPVWLTSAVHRLRSHPRRVDPVPRVRPASRSDCTHSWRHIQARLTHSDECTCQAPDGRCAAPSTRDLAKQAVALRCYANRDRCDANGHDRSYSGSRRRHQRRKLHAASIAIMSSSTLTSRATARARCLKSSAGEISSLTSGSMPSGTGKPHAP